MSVLVDKVHRADEMMRLHVGSVRQAWPSMAFGASSDLCAPCLPKRLSGLSICNAICETVGPNGETAWIAADCMPLAMQTVVLLRLCFNTMQFPMPFHVWC